MRLGILGSTRGTHLNAIHEAISNKILAASIEVVISNKADALILKKAEEFGYPALFVHSQGLTREEYDQQVSSLLKQHQVDFIVLIGYMRILSADFVNDWQNHIINVHPSLLPNHAGLMDLAVHQAVLDDQEVETGCTVHIVTENVDEGPIVMQKTCPVYPDDTAQTLKERVQVLEAQALVEALARSI